MNFRVDVLPEARQDLVRLGEFMGDFSPKLAERVRTLIVAAMISLERMPYRGAVMPGRLERRILVPFGSAGYEIRYRVTGDVVVITRIFHTREDR